MENWNNQKALEAYQGFFLHNIIKRKKNINIDFVTH